MSVQVQMGQCQGLWISITVAAGRQFCYFPSKLKKLSVLYPGRIFSFLPNLNVSSEIIFILIRKLSSLIVISDPCAAEPV